MSELIYKKVNEIFRHTDGNYYQCVRGLGCHNCAFWGMSACGQYACGEPNRPDRAPVKFVAVSNGSMGPKKEMVEDTVTEQSSRHIELGVVRDEGNWVLFKIVEQTHRGNEFCQQTAPDTFKASNGIELASVSSPAWGGANRLYCCGFLSLTKIASRLFAPPPSSPRSVKP